MADEKEFIIITKAKDLAFHTYDMTTARRFPKRHGKLAVDLMTFAREIVVHIQDANELEILRTRESSGNGGMNRNRPFHVVKTCCF